MHRRRVASFQAEYANSVQAFPLRRDPQSRESSDHLPPILLNIAFVSLSDNLDLSTASGRLMFNIIGAMAEFERALIQERVKAGIRNARAKGKRIGRPRISVDTAAIAALRSHGVSWRAISTQLGIGIATLHRAAGGRSKI